MTKKELKDRLCRLIRKEAFFRKKVVLSSGKTSNFYIDLRRVSLKSKGAFLIANLLWKELAKEKFSAIGGPTLGADPILSALAYHAHLAGASLKTFIVRKTRKKHGRSRLIEGPPLKKGSRVIIIDDVATTGKSLVESITKLGRLGIKVKKAYVVVDREEGAIQALARYRCPLVSLLKLRDITGST